MAISRRELLRTAGVLGVLGVAGCGADKSASSSTPTSALLSGSSRTGGPAISAGLTSSGLTSAGHRISRHAYGPNASQFGDLYLPNGTRKPGVVVIIHGGFWLAEYDLSLGAPLALDLVARGYAVLNLEYRRVGDGGGWPYTLRDLAAGIDQLAALDVDSGRVAAIGHSAGGQLATWAAGRAKLAPGAPGAAPKTIVTAVVSQAGVLALGAAEQQQIGGSAVSDFVGGTPTQVPGRYADADPIKQVPLDAPVLCVHSRDDLNVPFAQSTAYVAAATAAGASAQLAEVSGDHFTLIDPTSQAWATVVHALPGLLSAVG